MAVIGVGGKKRHGKDTFADALGDSWVKVEMSSPLFEALSVLDPYVGSFPRVRRVTAWLRWLLRGGHQRFSDVLQDVGGDTVRVKEHPEVRRLLQVLGTDVGRNMVGEDVWVNMMVARVQQLTQEGWNVVVTGVRFPNELAAIQKLDGYTVWVERPGFGEDTDVNSSHVSEHALTSRDFDTVVATPHIGVLREQAQKIAHEIGTF